jgi:hypothetical protein
MMHAQSDRQHVFNRHGFKRHEWLYCDSRQELVDLLRTYRHDFHITRWSVSTIRHFLSVYWHLYASEHPQEHHIRCIATIIEEAHLYGLRGHQPCG